MSYRRRDILAYGSAAAAAALAGCTSGDDGDDDEPNGTGDDGNGSGGSGGNRSAADLETVDVGSDVSVRGTSVAVSQPEVRSSLVSETDDGEFGLEHSRGTHFLLVRVDAGTGGPSPADFELLTESLGTYRPSNPTDGAPLSERGARYDPENGTTSGWLAFTLPGGVPVSTARVAVEGVDTGWDLGEETASALSEPVPVFSLDGVETPESVAPDETFEVTATFENESRVDGTARGLLTLTDPAGETTPFAVDVAAGETGAFTGEVTADAEASELALSLRSVAGDPTTLTVPVEETDDEASTDDDATDEGTADATESDSADGESTAEATPTETPADE